MPSRVQPPSDSDESILPGTGRRDRVRFRVYAKSGDDQGDGPAPSGGDCSPAAVPPISGEDISTETIPGEGISAGSGVDNSDLISSASGVDSSCGANGFGPGSGLGNSDLVTSGPLISMRSPSIPLFIISISRWSIWVCFSSDTSSTKDRGPFLSFEEPEKCPFLSPTSSAASGGSGGSAASSGVFLARRLRSRLRLILSQTPIPPAIIKSKTMATAIPAMAGVPSECEVCGVTVVIGGSVDEPVLVWEFVGEDRVVWVSTCWMAVMFDAES